MERRRQFIAGLRAVANFYEQNPGAWYDGMHLTLNMYVWGRSARRTLAEMARAFGQCNKVYDENNITVPAVQRAGNLGGFCSSC
jgi:hypothetical protein